MAPPARGRGQGGLGVEGAAGSYKRVSDQQCESSQNMYLFLVNCSFVFFLSLCPNYWQRFARLFAATCALKYDINCNYSIETDEFGMPTARSRMSLRRGASRGAATRCLPAQSERARRSGQPSGQPGQRAGAKLPRGAKAPPRRAAPRRLL